MIVKTQHHALLRELHDCLADLARDGVAPPAAERALDAVRGRHPGVRIDLVHETEAWSDAHHYEAIVQLPNGDALSLAYSADRARPWILRAAERWSDKDLLRVDGTILSVEQAMACIDFIWGEAPILQRLVNTAIVQEEQEKHPVEIGEDELQPAMDAFRRAQRLYTLEATESWLRERGLTHTQLEELVGDEATVAKQRRRIVGDGVAAHFAAHGGAYDSATILECTFQDAESAHLVHAAARDGVTELATLAARHVARSGAACPAAFRVLERGAEPSELAAAVFAAAPGALLEPLATENGYVVAQVLDLRPATLDARTAARIERELFDAWLAEKRRTSDVEWFWGSTARTEGKV